MEPYYQNKSVMLYYGDCHEILSALPKIDLLLSDPPYGINHKRGSSGDRGKSAVTLGTDGIEGDDKPFDPAPFLGFTNVILWGANWYADKLPGGRWLIWDKQEHGGSGDFSEAEIAWCNKGKSLKIFRHMWMGVQRASEIGQPRQHPTQKPVALMKWCITLAKLQPGATILDPFMGSGSTGIAALELGYKFIGIEKEWKHFDTARRRVAGANVPLFVDV